MPPKRILVTGATGKQGMALISALTPSARESESHLDTAPEFKIVALTRDASSHFAKALSKRYPAPIVEVVQGNLNSETSIREVFQRYKNDASQHDLEGEAPSIWGVFCVLAFPGLGANADGEEKQGKMMADLALEFGVKAFVFSSVERGGERDDEEAVLDRRAKVRIERHIKTLDLSWTILRPGFFMENYEGAVGSITVSVLKAGLKPSSTVQLVAADDIGAVAAGVFRNNAAFSRQILSVVGERSTMEQQQESYLKATGQSMPSAPAFAARALISMNGHTKALIADLERVHRIQEDGAAPDSVAQVTAAKKAHPGMKSLEEWARMKVEDAGSSERKKNWNQVSLWGLATGKH